jgi:hypothetical protein
MRSQIPVSDSKFSTLKLIYVPQGVFAPTLGSTPIYHLALKNLVFKLVEWVVLATPVFTIIVSDT